MKREEVLNLIDQEEERLRLEAERVQERMNLLVQHGGLFRHEKFIRVKDVTMNFFEGDEF